MDIMDIVGICSAGRLCKLSLFVPMMITTTSIIVGIMAIIALNCVTWIQYLARTKPLEISKGRKERSRNCNDREVTKYLFILFNNDIIP